MNKILSLSMRPAGLSYMLGQKKLVAAIQAQVEKRVPQAWMFTGSSGSGKTTIARIIAVALQCEHQQTWGDPCKECRGNGNFCIHEINASETSGVEELGHIAALSRYLPQTGKYRVVILDECFSEGALVDTPSGPTPIQEIKQGQQIANAWGVDNVKAINKKEVKSGARIMANGQEFISSRSHTYFTRRGWIAASCLEVGDEIITTNASMQILRQGFYPSFGSSETKILQYYLSSEISKRQEEHWLYPQSLYAVFSTIFGKGETRQEEHEVLRVLMLPEILEDPLPDLTTRNFQAYAGQEPYEEPAHQRKDAGNFAIHRTPPPDTRGQWPRTYSPSSIPTLVAGGRLESGVPCFLRTEKNGLPHVLQVGFGLSYDKDWNRSRWSLAQSQKRQQEGCGPGSIRVESVEVLESGNPILERYRSTDGRVYFYDIEAERHQSFSVNGVLVHNCQLLTNNAQNLLLKDFEDTPPTTVWIICTTAPNKILPALKRRCMTYQLNPLSINSRLILVQRAAKNAGYTKPTTDFASAASDAELGPAQTLMAFEKFSNGLAIQEAIIGVSAEVDSLALCRAVINGKWKDARIALQRVSAEESRYVRASLAGWLRSCLVREEDPKRRVLIADSLLDLTAMAPLEDPLLLIWLHAVIYKICRRLFK